MKAYMYVLCTSGAVNMPVLCGFFFFFFFLMRHI